MSRSEAFVTTATEKLMIYALGRLHYTDMPTVRSIVRRAAANDRFSSLMLGVTESAPFQMRKCDREYVTEDVGRGLAPPLADLRSGLY